MATRKETKRIIKIMQAYVDGKEIEYGGFKDNWTLTRFPSWQWGDIDYRVAKNKTKEAE